MGHGPSARRMSTLYGEVLRRLEGTTADRHGRFMNFGYRALPGEPTSGPRLPPRLPGRDSAQLTLEVVGDTDLSGRVLEVGCGRGGNLWLLDRVLGADQLIGVDLVPRAVAFARQDTRARHHLFLTADAERLPIASASVDVVLSIESSSTYAEPELFLRDVGRVLRPGGTFLYADLLPGPVVGAIGRACAGLGLREVHHRDISANVAASSTLREGREAFGFESGGPAPVGSADLDPLAPREHQYFVYRFVADGPAPATAPALPLFTASETALWQQTAKLGEDLLTLLLDGGLDRWLTADGTG